MITLRMSRAIAASSTHLTQWARVALAVARAHHSRRLTWHGQPLDRCL